MKPKQGLLLITNLLLPKHNSSICMSEPAPVFVKCPAVGGDKCTCTSALPCVALQQQCGDSCLSTKTSVCSGAFMGMNVCVGGDTFPVFSDEDRHKTWPEELHMLVGVLLNLVANVAEVLPVKLENSDRFACPVYCALDKGIGLKGTGSVIGPLFMKLLPDHSRAMVERVVATVAASMTTCPPDA